MKKKLVIKCFPVVLALFFMGCGQGDVSALGTWGEEEAPETEEAGAPKPEEEALELEAGMPDDEEAPDIRHTYLEAYGGKVFYKNVDGMAYFEGDIILGTTEEMEEIKAEVEHLEAGGLEPRAAYSMVSKGKPWPNNTIYYTIASDFPNQKRITDAIKHIHDKTNLRLVARTNTNQTNYVTFTTARKNCSSSVGMQWKQQFITLASGCDWVATVHEIGHAAGLWHEQSRSDRDKFITIHWENIEKYEEHNFYQKTGKDLGPYDYGSIMHYGPKDFSKNGKATITPKDSSAVIGQAKGLSKGDIDGLNFLYPKPPVCRFVLKPSLIPGEGGTYTFLASCSGLPTAYAWTVNGSLQPSKGNTLSYKFPTHSSFKVKTHTIVVTATNNGGSGKATAAVSQTNARAN